MPRQTKAEEEKLRKMEENVRKLKEAEAAKPLVAFSIEKGKGSDWTFIEYEVKNGKVINEQRKECMDKMHAIEVFKIAFVSRFFDNQ